MKTIAFATFGFAAFLAISFGSRLVDCPTAASRTQSTPDVAPNASTSGFALVEIDECCHSESCRETPCWHSPVSDALANVWRHVANNILGQYATDENIRMEQLLYQSEDLRPVRDEWSRNRSNDMPSHLTPQRLHGGITP